MFWFRKSFAGGHTFKNLSGELTPNIEQAPLPPSVVISLKQGFGEPVFPLVKVGDDVTAGQVIGASDSVSSPVHSSLNGTVRSITEIKDQFGNNVPAIVIDGDESAEVTRLSRYSPQFRKKKKEDVRHSIYRSGASALGTRGIPTQFKSSSIPLEKVTCVVVTALNSLPFALNNKSFLQMEVDHFLTGLSVLNYALEGVPVYLVINRRDVEIIEDFKLRSEKYPWLKVVPMKAKYPQEEASLLLGALFHQGSKQKRHAFQEGAVLLESQDVIQVYEAVVEGRPVIEKVIALGGSGFVKNMGLRVRIGTSVADIVEGQIKKEYEQRSIVGNFLNTPSQKDLSFPVTKDTDRITSLFEPQEKEFLAHFKPGLVRDSYSNSFVSKLFPFVEKRADTSLNGEERPCIGCGYCEDVCPVELLPYHLSCAAQKEESQKLIDLGLNRCIDCGLCSYVCPSKIPLFDQLLNGKRKVEVS